MIKISIRNKNVLRFLLTAAMAISMTMECFAASGRIAFSDPTAKVGDEVEVTVKFSTLDGSALGNTDVMLAYDAASLDYINETENASGGAGAIRVWSAPTGSSEAATVLRFKALKAGTTTITVSSYEAYDNNGGSIEVEKQGTSTITVQALETSSDDARLQSLQVSPGTLTPYFSPDVREYTMTVGLDTADLTVSAVPNNEKATVSVDGAAGLAEGENTVVCHVTAEDGTTTGDYTILVTKVEGGESTETGQTEGDEPEVLATLDVTAKKIRIIAKPDSVEVPAGFRESSIAIGDARVPGWTWAADESPRYCVFYGMNEAGEQNFYRYDLTDTEKTVQRYFADQTSSHTDEEYMALADNYNALVDDFNLCRILAAAFLGLAVILMIALIVAACRKPKDRNAAFRGADESSSKRASRKASGKTVSGKQLSKEERYMRGEEDEYEEESPEDADLEALKETAGSAEEIFAVPEEPEKPTPSAGVVSAGEQKEDDDFEFFDL